MLRDSRFYRKLRSVSLIVVLLGLTVQSASSFALSCIDSFRRYDYSNSHHLKMDQEPLSEHSLILDSNAVIALKKRAPDIEPSRLLARNYIGQLMKSGLTDLRITPSTATETSLTYGSDKPSVVFSQTRQSEAATDLEKSQIMKKLEEFEVGRAKGEMDRRIVTEAFLAKTNGSIPKFVSADKGLYYGLLRLKGIEPSRLERRAWDEFPDGFDVSIGKRTLRIYMIPPSHSD